jgi:predicted metal-dependent phosphoesterase TrpH
VSPGVSTRADLHVHSRHSDQPRIRATRWFRSQESYTEPLDVYRLARARGMDFVTISDHNSLDGSHAIAHLPGTFLSVEFDTWFPENGARVHVVATGIDEATFADAVKARESVYDLVACLRAAGTHHFLAHPLFDMTGKLTADIVEKCLLLFNVMEGLNGSRTIRCNGLLREVVAGLTPQRIADMAERQGIAPLGATPWRKSLVGGSDDHSGLFVAGAHTAADADGTLEGFFAAVEAGACAPAGDEGDARLLAHSIYAASFWKLREIMRLDQPAQQQRAMGLLRKGFGRIGREVPVLDKTVRGVRSIVPGLYRDGDPRGPAWEALLDEQLGSLLAAPQGIAAVRSRELNDRLFRVIARLADDVQTLHLGRLLAPGRLPLKKTAQSAFGVGMVQFLELPYYVAWHLQSYDRAAQNDLRARLVEAPGAGSEPTGAGVATGADGAVAPTSAATPRRLKLAVLSDAAPGSDGVAFDLGWLGTSGATEAQVLSLREGDDMAVALEQHGAPLTFAPLGERRRKSGALLRLPPLLDVLDHLEESGAEALHVTGPGPMGLAGVIAARLLHVPLGGACGAAELDALTAAPRLSPSAQTYRRYLRWFFRQLDAVVVTDREAGRRLAAAGVDPARVHIAGTVARAPRLRAPASRR